jgi:hypothetical protein
MKKLFPIVLYILLLLAGCDAPEESLLAFDTESLENFQLLFGTDYKMAVNEEGTEFFYKQDRRAGTIEVINLNNRTVNWYTLTEPLKYTDSANSSTVLKNGRRAYDYVELNMVDFVDRNIYFMLKEAGLTIGVADKKANFAFEYECEKQAGSVTPMLAQILNDVKMLRETVPDYTGDYFMTTDYHVAAVEGQSIRLAKYDSIISLQAADVIPELLTYSFSDSYTKSKEGNLDNEMIRGARGVNMYQNVIVYGQYDLCFSTDGSSQMLYNRERDFYEWVRDAAS